MELVDVVVVGAGLAGLRAAGKLSAAGLDVVLLEASDGPGGRVRSDRVDGLILDRGFQVLNTGYPAVGSCLDLDALQLRPFTHGAMVLRNRERWLLADPVRNPEALQSTVTAPVGSVSDKVRLAAMTAWDAYVPAAMLKGGRERTIAADLEQRGISAAMRDALLRPFLSGVFLDPDLRTSSILFHLVWRSLIRGVQALPANGMQAVADQLAARLPDGVLRLDQRVGSIVDREVSVVGGDTFRSEAILVATDGPAAAGLIPGLTSPNYRAVTTYYHLADTAPLREPVIVLDGTGQTPIANSVVLTNVAPSYADRDRVLVSTSILGAEAPPESEVREHLAQLYGVSTAEWEHVRTYPVLAALPEQRPPAALRKPVLVGERLYVAGDHRDTASLQGALVSGRRAAAAILHTLRPSES